MRPAMKKGQVICVYSKQHWRQAIPELQIAQTGLTSEENCTRANHAEEKVWLLPIKYHDLNMQKTLQKDCWRERLCEPAWKKSKFFCAA